MDQNRNLPVPGEFYRHFKNNIYQIVAAAYHSETGEPMVVYQALYGEYKIWACPLSLFMEEVDHEKYPQTSQKYRFERIQMKPAEPDGNREMDSCRTNPYLLEFFDAMDGKHYDRMLEALRKLAPKATKKEIGDICTVLDLQPSYGEQIQPQIAEIKQHILRLKKFDGERLR